MPEPVRYNFSEIARILKAIDVLQDGMDLTIKEMKEEAEKALGTFTGRARGQYDRFVIAFDAEKGRLYKLLDDTQEDSRQHALTIMRKEGDLAELFGHTTSQVGGS